MLIYLLAVVTGTAVAQEPLDRYLEMAAENNPRLKARFTSYQAALQQVPQVGALPDPQVAFGYFIQPVETRVGPQQARLTASQIFPWFGTLEARESAATERAREAWEAFEEARSELFYQVRSAYYDLYVTDKSIAITRENMEILQSFLRLTTARMETGSAPATERLRTEIALADLENQLATLLDRQRYQEVKFNRLLDSDEPVQVALPGTLPEYGSLPPRTALMDSIRTGNHTLRALDHRESALREKEDAARKAGMPSFSVGLQYMVTGLPDDPAMAGAGSGNDAVVLPTVGISIPLYRKKYRAMVRETVYRQEATGYQRSSRQNRLETLLEKGLKEYRDAERRIALFERQTERARQVIRLMESQYATAGNEFDELLRLERDLLRYAIEQEKARADQWAAVAFIDYLTGK